MNDNLIYGWRKALAIVLAGIVLELLSGFIGKCYEIYSFIDDMSSSDYTPLDLLEDLFLGGDVVERICSYIACFITIWGLTKVSHLFEYDSLEAEEWRRVRMVYILSLISGILMFLFDLTIILKPLGTIICVIITFVMFYKMRNAFRRLAESDAMGSRGRKASSNLKRYASIGIKLLWAPLVILLCSILYICLFLGSGYFAVRNIRNIDADNFINGMGIMGGMGLFLAGAAFFIIIVMAIIAMVFFVLGWIRMYRAWRTLPTSAELETLKKEREKSEQQEQVNGSPEEAYNGGQAVLEEDKGDTDAINETVGERFTDTYDGSEDDSRTKYVYVGIAIIVMIVVGWLVFGTNGKFDNSSSADTIAVNDSVEFFEQTEPDVEEMNVDENTADIEAFAKAVTDRIDKNGYIPLRGKTTLMDFVELEGLTPETIDGSGCCIELKNKNFTIGSTTVEVRANFISDNNLEASLCSEESNYMEWRDDIILSSIELMLEPDESVGAWELKEQIYQTLKSRGFDEKGTNSGVMIPDGNGTFTNVICDYYKGVFTIHITIKESETEFD